MPWLWLPVLVLISVHVPAFAGVRLAPAALLLPVAAWLAARYGRSGLAVVVLSGLVVVPRLSFEYLSLGGELGWWMAAVVVGAVAASPLPLAERLSPVRDRQRTVTAFGLVVLLPVSLDLGEVGWADDLPITLGASLWPAFYLLLFILGARRAPWMLALASVATTLVGGWLVILTGLHESWGSSLRYGIISPASVTAALACFAVGRAVHGDVYGRRRDVIFARHPLLAVIGLLLLWAVPDTLSAIRLPVDGARWLLLFGSYYLLPLAAFLAGWTWGAGGVRFVAGATVVLILLRHLADYFIEGSILLAFNVEWLFIPYLYGAFGVAARLGREHAAATVPWRRDAFLFSAILVTPILFQLDTPEGGAAALAFLLVVTGIALAAGRVGARSARLGMTLRQDRWFAAAASLFALAAMGRHFGHLLAALREAVPAVLAPGTTWQEGESWIIGFTAALLAILSISVAALARSVPAILEDLVKLRAAIRYYRDRT